MNSRQELESILSLASVLQGSKRQHLPNGGELGIETRPLSEPLVARLFSSPEEISELGASGLGLPADQGMLLPSFFLASLLPQEWKPRVVVVTQGQTIIGLLYCKERVVAGIGTRIAFGDDTLGAMVMAGPQNEARVMLCAVKALLQHMVALRFLVPSNRLSLLKRA